MLSGDVCRADGSHLSGEDSGVISGEPRAEKAKRPQGQKAFETQGYRAGWYRTHLGILLQAMTLGLSMSIPLLAEIWQMLLSNSKAWGSS